MELVESTTEANPFMDEEGNLTATGFASAARGLAIIQQACHLRAKSKGWWPELTGPMASENSVPGRNFGEMIALMHSELSEALEAYRDGDVMTTVRYEYPTGNSGTQILYNKEFVYANHTELGKPVGVASELADVLIRIFDTAEALDIPLVKAVMDKHDYNGTRKYRHGGKKA